MPPVSKKQSRFLQGVKSGSISAPGLSQDKAAEMVDGYPTKDLPETSGRSSQRKRQSMKKGKGKAPAKPPMKGAY